MGRFIMKHIDNRKPQIMLSKVQIQENKPQNKSEENIKVQENTQEKNNKTVNEQVMTTSEKIAMAQNVLNGTVTTKRIKRDKGLIERTESSKTILTEDNKELLND